MDNPFESINARLSNIETLLVNLNFPTTQPPQPQPDRWMNIDELCDYLPDHPVKFTVYSWVAKSAIPVNKKSKKLFFLKSEIDAWLNSGRKKTYAELYAETSRKTSRR